MAPDPLSLHIVAPLTTHTSTIIFLHGRGATGPILAEELFESESSPPNPRTPPELLPSMKWVFPTARLLHSTSFDSEMNQWFDMTSTSSPYEGFEVQQPGLRRSVASILEVVKAELEIVGGGRVILAGISQGAAVAVHVLAYLDRKIAGFVVLSSWFAGGGESERLWEGGGSVEAKRRRFKTLTLSSGSADEPDIYDRDAAWGLDIPALVAHCRDDEVINISDGRRMADLLGMMGAEVQWKAYEDGGHWLNEPTGVEDLVAFVKGVLE